MIDSLKTPKLVEKSKNLKTFCSKLHSNEELLILEKKNYEKINIFFKNTQVMDTDWSNTNRSENDSTIFPRIFNFGKIVRVKE